MIFDHIETLFRFLNAPSLNDSVSLGDIGQKITRCNGPDGVGLRIWGTAKAFGFLGTACVSLIYIFYKPQIRD